MIPNRLTAVLLTLMLVVTINSCGGNSMNATKGLSEFSKLIEQGKLGDTSLTIYYMSPYTFTLYPYSVNDLISSLQGDKIVVSGSSLVEHIDLFSMLTSEVVTPVEHKSYIDARIYYAFENSKGRKIFDVVMWGGDDNSMFVNGTEVKGNNVFCQAIIPFLPEDAARELEKYMNRSRRE